MGDPYCMLRLAELVETSDLASALRYRMRADARLDSLDFEDGGMVSDMGARTARMLDSATVSSNRRGVLAGGETDAAR